MRAPRRLGHAAGIILVASLLTACGPPGSAEQARFAEIAANLTPPDGFVIGASPTRQCETLTTACDDATVIATWVPAEPETSSGKICAAYLVWATKAGVSSVFIGTGGRWADWFEPDQHALIVTGATDTIPIGTPDAVELCVTIVQRLIDLPPDASRASVYELIGIGGVPGVAGGLLVTRVMPPRSVPDGGAERDAGPVMIAAVGVLI